MNGAMREFMPIDSLQGNTKLLTLPQILRILTRWQELVLKRNRKMKLLRYGPKGKEKPGILDKAGKIRDLSR